MPFWIVPLGFILAGFVLWAYMTAKIDNAMKNQMIIVFAIFRYQKDRMDAKDLDHVNDVNFSDMENFETTVYRLTDWGYKRILPKEKYKLVKPFIKRNVSIEKIRESVERLQRNDHPPTK